MAHREANVREWLIFVVGLCLGFACGWAALLKVMWPYRGYRLVKPRERTKSTLGHLDEIEDSVAKHFPARSHCL